MILNASPSYIKLHFWCNKNFFVASFIFGFIFMIILNVRTILSILFRPHLTYIWPHNSQVIEFKPFPFQDLPPGSNLKFPSGNKECFTAEFFDFSFDTHFQFWFATYRSAIFFLSLRDFRIRFLDRPNILLKIFAFMSSAFFARNFF